MSDVEKQIEQWRASLGGTETLGAADIRELESHLREEIDHLKSLSLSEDEAFLVAQHRLGDTARLEQEFAKIHPHGWLVSRLCWITAGILLWMIAGSLGTAVSIALLWLGCLHILGTVGLVVVRNALALVTMATVLTASLWRYLWYTRTHLQTEHGLFRATTIALAMGALLIIQVVLGLNIGLYVWVTRPTEITLSGPVVQPGMFNRDLAWALLTPTLLTGLFAVLYLRGRREAPVQ